MKKGIDLLKAAITCGVEVFDESFIKNNEIETQFVGSDGDSNVYYVPEADEFIYVDKLNY